MASRNRKDLRLLKQEKYETWEMRNGVLINELKILLKPDYLVNRKNSFSNRNVLNNCYDIKAAVTGDIEQIRARGMRTIGDMDVERLWNKEVNFYKGRIIDRIDDIFALKCPENSRTRSRSRQKRRRRKRRTRSRMKKRSRKWPARRY